jgi:undecaprenyl phosphate-alpha-L-ara4N flippase subunit ArnE
MQTNMKTGSFPVALVIFILCMTCSQIMLKAAGIQAATGTGILEKWVLNLYLWLALLCYSISLPFWAYTLRQLPLASAFAWTALVYVLTPLAGAFFWREQLSVVYCLGIFCIVGGIIIAAGNAQSE